MRYKRKELKFRKGYLKKFVQETGFSEPTVRAALRYENDTDIQRDIRDLAMKSGYLKLEYTLVEDK